MAQLAEYNIEHLLHDAVRKATALAMEAAVDAAIVDLRRRMNEQADRLALSIMTEYRVERNGRDVIIRVTKAAD